MASSIQLLRSSTARERPTASNLLDGQPAVNVNVEEPGLFFKATDGSMFKVGPAFVSEDGSPPNSSPTGSAGNSRGEIWLDKSTTPPLIKVWDGSSWVASGDIVNPGNFVVETTARKRPQPGSLLQGQPAVNVNSTEPGLFFRGTDGSLFKVGPVAVSATQPNDPAAGSTGNAVGEMWLDISGGGSTLKIYDGASWLSVSGAGGADASETVKGIAELATQAETDAGTDDSRIVTPLKLQTKLEEANAINPDGVYTVVNVKDFGAVGDGVTDDTQAIQNAIDYAIYRYDARTGKYPGWPGTYNGYDTSIYDQRICHRVYIPAGRYVTSGVIFIGYGCLVVESTSGEYNNVLIFGDGGGSEFVPGRAGFDGGFSGTYIISTNAAEPCFCTQGMRAICTFEKIALIGDNFNYIRQNIKFGRNQTSLTIDDTDLSNWVDPAFSDPTSLRYAPNANSQYAPYAGICIDGYSGTAKTTVNANGDYDNKYPDYNYPAWLDNTLKPPYTAITQYGKTMSSKLKVVDCYIQGFVVGAMVSPNATGNGDFITFTRSTISLNVYGLSSGSQDSRLMNCQDVDFTGSGIALTCLTHGSQLGKVGGVQNGSCFDACRTIYTINSATSGPVLFLGCYGEHIYQIGNPGQYNSTPMASKFINCEFNFLWQSEYTVVGSAPLITASEDNVIFEGGGLSIPANMNVFATSGGPTFRDTAVRIREQNVTKSGLTPLSQMATGNDPSDPDKAWGLAAQRYSQCFLSPINNGLSERIYSTEIGTPSPPTSYAYWQSGGQLTQIANELRHSPVSHAVPDLRLLNIDKNINAVWSFTTDGDGLQFYEGTITLSGSDPYGVYLSKGDLVYDRSSNTAFVIYNVSGSTVSIRALNNIYVPLKFTQGSTDNSLKRLKVPVNLASGNRWAYHPVRLFSPTAEYVGSITAGSPTVTITRADGAAFSGAGVSVNDRLVCNANFAPFSGHAIVTNIVGNTVTFDRNANFTADRVPMNFWIRRPYA